MLKLQAGKKVNVAVVIPAYKVRNLLSHVIRTLPNFVDHIIVIDDACPQKSGKEVEREFKDNRIKVLYHTKNQGVGGSVKTGYSEALKLASDVIVKFDGDGQMNPLEIEKLISKLIQGNFDYAKGNRFYSLENVKNMPLIRVIGNIALSFMSKMSTGYYKIFDPNNGFTAITRESLQRIPLSKIDNRYFFESDMLFQLNLARCTVLDVPMDPIYRDEKSNLNVKMAIPIFWYKHSRNFFKRIIYSYFIRDFNIASLQLLLGTTLFTWGLVTGLKTWLENKAIGVPSQPGTMILVAILIVSGLQLLLSFINSDMNNQE